MTDEEYALYISEALYNLKDEYPNKHLANQAYGALIMGRLNINPSIMTYLRDDDHPYVRQEIIKE